MGNAGSWSEDGGAPDPRQVEELIALLEREQRKNADRPLPLDSDSCGDVDSQEVREFQQLQELLAELHARYPQLLHGEAGDDVAPLKLPAELLGDIQRELAVPIPDDCSEQELAEVQRLSALLAQLGRFEEPYRPWTGGWVREPADVTADLLSSVLQMPVHHFEVQEQHPRRAPFRELAVTAHHHSEEEEDDDDEEKELELEEDNGEAGDDGNTKIGDSATPRRMPPTHVVLQIPNASFLQRYGEAASRQFLREVTFMRHCVDEIPLETPALLGVWDDGRGTDMQNFLLVFRDVGHCSVRDASATATTGPQQALPPGSAATEHGVHPSLDTLEHVRQVLRDLAQFHGYFFSHAMVVSKPCSHFRLTVFCFVFLFLCVVDAINCHHVVVQSRMISETWVRVRCNAKLLAPTRPAPKRRGPFSNPVSRWILMATSRRTTQRLQQLRLQLLLRLDLELELPM